MLPFCINVLKHQYTKRPFLGFSVFWDIIDSNGDRSTTVVHQLVELGVAGSNPVGHPIRQAQGLRLKIIWTGMSIFFFAMRKLFM